MKSNYSKKYFVFFFVVVVLLSLNMRASYTGIGTIVQLIMNDLKLSNAAAGMITTIPILVYAVVCPIASRLSTRWGIGKMLEAALVIIAVGCGLRGFFGGVGLYAGTTILSIGIGIMNSLMIALIKLKYPNRTGLLTSAYTTTMALTTALSMGMNIHICRAIGWKMCLSIWAIPAVLAVIVWGPQCLRPENSGITTENPEKPRYFLW